MEVANTIYYDTEGFTLDLLQNALYELCATKLDFGERHFVIKTGEYKRVLTLLPVSYSNVA